MSQGPPHLQPQKKSSAKCVGLGVEDFGSPERSVMGFKFKCFRVSILGVKHGSARTCEGGQLLKASGLFYMLLSFGGKVLRPKPQNP